MILSFSLVVIDIDYFKKYNDTYGHRNGDMCLIKVADILAKGVRENDRVCRIGGEEFCIILPSTNKDEAISLAERVCRKVEALKIPHIKSDVSHYVTVSIGVTTANISDDSVNVNQEQLFVIADKALYMSKRDGRNRVSFR